MLHVLRQYYNNLYSLCGTQHGKVPTKTITAHYNGKNTIYNICTAQRLLAYAILVMIALDWRATQIQTRLTKNLTRSLLLGTYFLPPRAA